MFRIFGQYFSPRKTIFILGEGILIYAAVTIAAYFIIGESVPIIDVVEMFWARILLVAVVAQLSLYFNDLYEFNVSENMIDLATRLIQSVGITSIVLAVVYFIWPDAIIGRWIFFASIIILLLFLVSWRILYTIIIQKRIFVEKAIVIGVGELASDIMREIKNRRDSSYDIKGLCGHENEKNIGDNLGGVPIKYGFKGLCDFAIKEQAASLIVAMDEKRGFMPYDQLLNCKVKGISIIDGESFYERITGKILVEKINPSWLIFSDGFKKSNANKIIKRFTGLLLSSTMLVCLFPFMLLVAIAIKLESRGPVIFSQERVGENQELFTLYKFRSMKMNAEKESGPVWATEDDPRITKIGKIIRKLRIDELPQLYNVFKGDMSFVGPRPEREHFVDILIKKVPYYRERFSVKPGLTGWAQIKYPYGATEKDALEKLKYELYYIKNMTMIMDLMIIFHTVKIVLLGRGSR